MFRVTIPPCDREGDRGLTGRSGDGEGTRRDHEVGQDEDPGERRAALANTGWVVTC